MKRTQGAPPVTLCLVTTTLLVLHVTAIIYTRHRIHRLETRVRDAPPPVLSRNFEDDGVPLRYQPTGSLSGETGLLAGLREIDRELPRHHWLTGVFFLGSLAWLKAPRTS